MLFYIPVLRIYRYLFFVIIILFGFIPCFLVIYHQYVVSCQPVSRWTIESNRYEDFCLQVQRNIELECPTNIPVELNLITESIPYFYSQWQSTEELPRLITQCEHAIYMHLLTILIKKVFQKYGIQYMMVGATLLGSYISHDILPWDDDVDISVPIYDRVKLQTIIIGELSSEPYSIIHMHMHSEHTYDKIFFSWSPRAGDMPWRFPFIDICYHEQNSTHVWLSGQTTNCPILQEDVFPLVLRPLGSLWLYAPREPMAQFEARKMKQIETVVYVSPYSRKHERSLTKIIPYIDRSILKSFYPYVERHCTTDSCTEYLKLGEQTILQKLTYQYSYRTFLYAERNRSYTAC